MAASGPREPTRITAAPGPAAVRAVGELIEAAKGGDAFAPVTVVVPSRRSALSLRRELAAVAADRHGHRGLVNVRFELATRLAELLGAPALARAGRRPAQPAVIHEAIRGVLSADPGPFSTSATHPATIQQIARSYRDLRSAPGALEAIGGSGRRGAALARVFAQVQRALSPWYDDTDQVSAAADALRLADPSAPDELGPVICFAPQPTDTIVATLIDALGARATVLELAEPAPTDPALHRGLAIVSASDPDEEARAAVRSVRDLLAQGVPLHRIAIAHTAVRYAPALHQHLERAGLPHHGPAVRRLAQTVGGVTLTGLLALAENDLPRDGVIEWLSGAPILEPATGALAPTSSWDLASREAGVIAGAGQWAERLARYAETIDADDEDHHRADDEPGGPEARARRIARQRATVEGLQAFVAELTATVEGARTQPWSAWVTWAVDALETWLGKAPWRARWPDAELEAFDQLLGVLGGLSLLDGLAPAPSLGTFRSVLSGELEAPAGRVGTFGDGTFVGSLRSMTGLAYDAIVVVGAAEGLLPQRTVIDPLLGDAERAAAHLPDPGRAVDEQRRDLFVALATARDHRVVTVPRGDLRSNHAYLPSRWVVALAEAASNTVVATDGLTAPALAPLVTTVQSFADGVRRDDTGLTEPERVLQELWAAASVGLAPAHEAAVLADPRLAASLRADQQRTFAGFTELDGRIGPDAAPEVGSRPLSPTSLQTYAQCPRKYLFAKVLGLGAVERPEELTRVKASTRGTLVHKILERWVADRIAGVPGADTTAHLLALADTAFADLEARGQTGRALTWRYDTSVIRRELVEVAARDRGTPLAVELRFGGNGEAAVEVALPSGVSMAFRGTVDRVDRADDGALEVTDYKTGSKADYAKLEETTVARGELLQLPLYALAARQRFGDEGTTVRAAYWFVTEKAGYAEIGYEVDDQRLAVLTDTLEVIVDGIHAGRFPGRPGPFDTWLHKGRNCRYCEFDRVCPTNRVQQWERTSTDPALATYVELTTGPKADEATA